jgi:hypothetical protein
MARKIPLLALCLLFSCNGSIAQRKTPHRVRTIALNRVGEYPNRYMSGLFRIPNIVLEDVRPVQNSWPFVLQLYDPATGFRRGRELKGSPFDPHDFLICAPKDVGTSLFERKDNWRNHKVNIYLIMQDVGLTVFVYAGYVTKLELLDDRGKVIDTIGSGQ